MTEKKSGIREKLSSEEINYLLLMGKTKKDEERVRAIARDEGLDEEEVLKEYREMMQLFEVGEKIGDKIIISPEVFAHAFFLLQDDFESKLVESWEYPGRFTNKMIGRKADDKSFLHMVADILNLKYYREYWSLDAVFYKKEDKEHFQPPFLCAEYLPVVIEHENSIDGSYLEMNKLSIFNSPLKVLITYPEEQDKNKYLDCYAQILKNADIFNDFSTKRKHLVVFGTRQDNRTSWEFYVYQNGKFSLIPDR
jgi:hypothetical protein